MQGRAYIPLVLVLIAGLLGGCAADRGEYPSLGRRAAERLHEAAPAMSPETPITQTSAAPSAELAAQLARLIGQAEAAQSRFAAREPRARTLAQAAAGAPLGSESWSLAAIAFAELESARSDTMIALADLDLLHASATVEGAATAAIAAARNQVIEIVAAQDRVLAQLRGDVSG